MARANYKFAVEWLAYNDDNEWLTDEYGMPSVALSLVADVFGKPIEIVTADLRKAVKRLGR
jgi:hypothetical protein